jgi:thermitase
MKVAARYALLAVILAVCAFALPAVPATAATDVPSQWALSTAHVTDAWALSGDATGATAGAGVLVGVVDSGVALGSPELSGATEVAGTDVVDGDGDATDDNGHGTAVASEIVGDGRYAGVARGAKLVVAQVLDAHGAGTTAELAAGLGYVGDQGARVAVVSIGGTRSAAVEQAIASHPGTLYVVAAGNAGGDVDGASSTAASTAWPCADDAANVICVGASDKSDALASISNYGATSVDLAAPGVSVQAATLTGTGTWTGTSFAAPLVAGVAALAFAQDPSATVAQVKAALIGSTDRFTALSGTSVSGGRLNAYRALKALAGADPGQAAPATATASTTTPTTAAAQAPAATTTAAVAVSTTAQSKSTERRAVVKATAKRSSKVKKTRSGKHKAQKTSKRVSKVTATRHHR